MGTRFYPPQVAPCGSDPLFLAHPRAQHFVSCPGFHMASFESHIQVLERAEVQNKNRKNDGSGIEAAGAPAEPSASELLIPRCESRFLHNVWLPDRLSPGVIYLSSDGGGC